MQSKKIAIYISVYITIFSLGILTGYYSASKHKEYIYVETPSEVSNPEEEVKKAPLPQDTDSRTFFIQSKEDKIIIYLCLPSGEKEIDSEIDYIDIYSLDASQREALSKGVSMPSKDAVAEFIQDLGS